jgi:hypothetical protein
MKTFGFLFALFISLQTHTANKASAVLYRRNLEQANLSQVEKLLNDCKNEINLSLRNGVIFIDNMPFRVVAFPTVLAASPVTASFGIYSLHYTISDLMKDQTSIVYKENSKLDFVSKLSVEFLPPDSIPSLPLNEMLIVLTTCNQLNMTILALDYLKDSFSEADLIIVDDYSVDGTPEYLIKKGYTVITKDHAKGLTDSWNKGYEFANVMKYKYVIFTNNDVLLTSTTVKVMKEDLKNEALVGPLTTLIGAGHNPSQVYLYCCVRQ